MTNIMTCSNLKKSFENGYVAINGLSLTLHDGEILSILGPSGCGKTTLLRLIAGLEIPDTGSIVLNGETLFDNKHNVPSHKRGLGMVFQEYALYPHLTVSKNILFGISQMSEKEKTERLAYVSDITKINELAERYPSELSGGQQQRVALARTLARNPTLLLMDEPFSNLDSSLRASMRIEVKDILKQSGTSTVFVTHDKEEAFSISDRVGIMAEGKLEQIDPPDKLYFWPESRKIAILSGACDFITGKINGNSVSTVLGQLPLRLAGVFENGTSVEVAIRPNDFNMTPDRTGNGVVIDKQFMGDDTIFSVKTNNNDIIHCKHKTHTTLFKGIKVNVSPSPYITFNVFKQ